MSLFRKINKKRYSLNEESDLFTAPQSSGSKAGDRSSMFAAVGARSIEKGGPTEGFGSYSRAKGESLMRNGNTGLSVDAFSSGSNGGAMKANGIPNGGAPTQDQGRPIERQQIKLGNNGLTIVEEEMGIKKTASEQTQLDKSRDLIKVSKQNSGNSNVQAPKETVKSEVVDTSLNFSCAQPVIGSVKKSTIVQSQSDPAFRTTPPVEEVTSVKSSPINDVTNNLSGSVPNVEIRQSKNNVNNNNNNNTIKSLRQLKSERRTTAVYSNQLAAAETEILKRASIATDKLTGSVSILSDTVSSPQSVESVSFPVARSDNPVPILQSDIPVQRLPSGDPIPINRSTNVINVTSFSETLPNSDITERKSSDVKQEENDLKSNPDLTQEENIRITSSSTGSSNMSTRIYVGGSVVQQKVTSESDDVFALSDDLKIVQLQNVENDRNWENGSPCDVSKNSNVSVIRVENKTNEERSVISPDEITYSSSGVSCSTASGNEDDVNVQDSATSRDAPRGTSCDENRTESTIFSCSIVHDPEPELDKEPELDPEPEYDARPEQVVEPKQVGEPDCDQRSVEDVRKERNTSERKEVEVTAPKSSSSSSSSAAPGAGKFKMNAAKTVFAVNTRDETVPDHPYFTRKEEMPIMSRKGSFRGKKNLVKTGISAITEKQDGKVHKDYENLMKGKILLYTSSCMVIRERRDKCAKVKKILQNHRVYFEERDVYLSNENNEELIDHLHGQQDIDLPQVFVEDVLIGGFEEMDRLNETGVLRQIFKDFKKVEGDMTCDGCGGFRYTPCYHCHGSKQSRRNYFTEEFRALRCTKCDENGLVRCRVCNTPSTESNDDEGELTSSCSPLSTPRSPSDERL